MKQYTVQIFQKESLSRFDLFCFQFNCSTLEHILSHRCCEVRTYTRSSRWHKLYYLHQIIRSSLSLSLSLHVHDVNGNGKKNHVLIGSKQSSYQLQPSKFAAVKHYKQPNGGRYDYVKYEFQDDI
ncbi:hypothetical protein ACB098_04G057000 [Castanea mollissima]